MYFEVSLIKKKKGYMVNSFLKCCIIKFLKHRWERFHLYKV